MNILTESFLQELQHSVVDVEGDEHQQKPQASCDWGTQKTLLSDWWVKERPQFLNSMVVAQNATTQICQQCCNSPAVVRCRDCRPRSLLCGECDVHTHIQNVLHNRDTTVSGYFQPLPPTACVVGSTISECGK